MELRARCQSVLFWGLFTLFLTAFLILLSAQQVSAQVLYGSIVGNVRDQSGAAVPGADVTITHNETSQERSGVTNDVGVYNFPTIPTGTYTVSVAMPGFKEFLKTQVPVTLNSISRVDVTLEVGEVTETLTVRSAATLLKTDRAEVSAELPEKTLANLPVPLGRNYQHLFGLLPGISTPYNAHSIPTNPSRALRFEVNGVSGSSNDIRIDGASNYDIWLPHITAYIPALEAIETVNVVTSSFDAEQGLAGGASINVQIKSGTNALRGSLFEYNNNNALMAKPFFLPQGQRNPKSINNQFGGTIGGPIQKDRLFFFASYEGSMERAFASSLQTIPTLAMRTGDLSASDRPIYDPFTGKSDGSGRTAFATKIIPSDRMSPIAKKIIALLPTPTYDGESSNYFAQGRFTFDRHTVDTKVDWRVNEQFNMYGRFSILNYDMNAPTVFGDQLGGEQLAGGNPGHGWGNSYSATIAGTYVWTPTFVVDANFGYMRKDTSVEQTRLDEKIGLDLLGIKGTNGPRRFESGWPRFSVSGFATMGVPNNFMPYYRRDPQRQVAGNANWTKGKHNLRFGGEVYAQQMNHTQPEFPGASHPAQGGFSFSGGVTTVRGGPSSNRYNAMAAFLLDAPSGVGRIFQIPDEYNTRASMYSLYIRDRWQITPKFTFTIGSRWEYYPLPTRADRGIERYDFVTNKMLVCGVGSVPKDCGVSLSKTLFAPRVGIAYRVTEKFVIRAGYGLTNDPFSLARPHRTNHPMLLALNITAPNSFLPAGSMKDGVPTLATPDLGNGIIDVPTAVAINSVGEKFRRGYVQSWNLTLQRELPGNFSFQVGYVATRQVRQIGYFDLNAGQIVGAGRSGQPFFQRFGRTTGTRLFGPIGHSKYDSLQAVLTRRFANGFQFDANYTWSKALGVCGITHSDNNPCIQAISYFHLNRALSNLHMPHRLNFSTIMELPFGPGKRWATDGRGAALLGGWQLNVILQAYSGSPFTVSTSGTSLNLPGSSQRADRVKNQVVKLKGIGRGQAWFDPFAFAPVTEPRFGTNAFNSMQGPGQFNMDVGIFRKFQISEDVTLEFRAEAFNFTNTPHFRNPGTSVSSMRLNKDKTIRSLSGYTEVTATRGTGREGIDQRIFRFGLRLVF